MISQEKLKENILLVMGKRELTVHSLAIRSGIAPGNLWRKFNTEKDTRVSTLLQIAAGLGVNAGRLFSREMEKTKWFKELKPFSGKVKDGVWIDEPVQN